MPNRKHDPSGTKEVQTLWARISSGEMRQKKDKESKQVSWKPAPKGSLEGTSLGTSSRYIVWTTRGGSKAGSLNNRDTHGTCLGSSDRFIRVSGVGQGIVAALNFFGLGGDPDRFERA